MTYVTFSSLARGEVFTAEGEWWTKINDGQGRTSSGSVRIFTPVANVRISPPGPRLNNADILSAVRDHLDAIADDVSNDPANERHTGLLLAIYEIATRRRT